MPKRSRRDVTKELLAAGRTMSGAAVMYHTAVAEKQGLSATEVKTIDMLHRFGPMTAGELSSKSGLAPPSITGLVDRLEKKGFVRRQPDAADGRRVQIHLRHEQVAEFGPLFDDFVVEMERLCAQYSVEQLELITRFLVDSANLQRRCAAKLSGTSKTQEA